MTRQNPAIAQVEFRYTFVYMISMRHTSFSDLRKNLAAMIDAVNDDHTPLLITRNGGKPPAVLMSLEDFSALTETNYLTSSPTNAKRLLNAIRELDAGKGEARTLLE
jgi:antitoxin YefM